MKRFWSKVKKTNGCWEWTACKLAFGYGRFAVDGVQKVAHRVSWELTNGPIPDGRWVLHKCDNPSCVNPLHLFLGNHTDNMRDMVLKKRHAAQNGRGGNAKLCPVDVQLIRDVDSTHKSMADWIGVSESLVRQIRKKKVWRNI